MGKLKADPSRTIKASSITGINPDKESCMVISYTTPLGQDNHLVLEPVGALVDIQEVRDRWVHVLRMALGGA